MQEVFEKIINRFLNIRSVVKNDEDLEWNRAVYKCTEIVRQEATVYKNRWIPCSEHMPDPFENVLISTKQGGRAIAHRCPNQAFGRYYDLHSSAIDDVVAWQPLPDPYHSDGERPKKTNFDRCCESMVVEVDLTGEDMWEIQQVYISAETQYNRTKYEEVKTKCEKTMNAMRKMLSAYAEKQSFYTVDDMKIGISDYKTQ